jgi:hypothetical protein
MDRRQEKKIEFKKVLEWFLSDYDSSEPDSFTTLSLYKDKNGKPSGYKIEGSRKQIVEIVMSRD